MIERIAERAELRFVPPRAKTQNQAALANLVERIRHLGQQGRIAERRTHHQRANLDALGGLGQRRQQCPALPDTASRLVLPLEQQMVGDPDGIEPVALDRERRIANLPISQHRAAIRFGDRQHDPDFHNRSLD